MLRCYLADLIVFFGFSAVLISMPVITQYIYERVAESHNSTKTGNTYCTENDTANQTQKDQIVADEVAQWTLNINLLNYIPGIFSGMLLTSCGDKLGRRTVMAFPLAGIALSLLIQELVIVFRLPLTVLYASAAVAGLTGTTATMLAQGAAYICNVTQNQNKGLRLAKLNAAVGLGGGLAGLASGYWITDSGYIPPNLLGIGISTLGFFLLPFLPDESKILKQKNLECERKRDSDAPYSGYGTFPNHDEPGKETVNCNSNAEKSSSNQEAESQYLVDNSLNEKARLTFLDLLRSMLKVYTTEYISCEQCFGTKPSLDTIPVNAKCIHGGRIIRGRVWRFWSYTLIMFFFIFIAVGSLAFQTMFLLSYPLCFTPILIGIQQALLLFANGASPIFALLFERILNLSGNAIIFLGLLGLLFQQVVMCFSREPYVVFIATCGMALAWIVKPFTQNQLSSLASPSEQGVVFAIMSGAEVSALLVSTVSFLPLYPATLYISHWFSWLFTSCLCSIPLMIIGVIWVADYRRQMQSCSEVLQPLVNSYS